MGDIFLLIDLMRTAVWEEFVNGYLLMNIV